MNTHHCRRLLRRLPLAPLAVALALTLAAPPAGADDRSLLEPTQKNPYVFIILDTSGSMHQEINCSAADAAKGYCSLTQVCPNGNCLPRLMGDDPDSKIYTAKQVIYNLMASHPNINFGFGHFDQSNLQVSWKYWWYQLAAGQTGILLADNVTTYPVSQQQELFGDQAWGCTTASPAPFSNVGCISTQPAHLDNAWEWERARRFPKLGDTNNVASTIYYFTQKSDNSLPLYRVTFAPVVGQTMGAATMTVSVKVDKCSTSACGSVSTMGTKVLTFNLANPTIYWETGLPLNGTNVPDASGNGGNFYATRQINQSYSGASLKMEDNSDTTTTDPWSTSALCVAAGTCDMQEPTTADPLSRSPATVFSLGDIIPLDWKNNQQTLVSQRMAPNLIGGSPLPGCPAPATTPDFGIANYLADHPLAGESALRLKCSVQRPLAPDGGTPTGHVMMSFANWLTNGTTTWPATAFAPNAAASSWIGTASGASGDPFFACKHAYVLILTDGLASSDDGNWDLNTGLCPQYTKWAGTQTFGTKPGFACCAAEALRSITYGAAKTPWPVRTYVVGLGLPAVTVATYNNTLSCIADEGGTGFRHFINGDTVTNGGFPASDPPPANFCTTSNPCDGPGPFIPQNKQQLADALQSVLNLIESQTAAFASAAVPSLQSNVANESILTSFLPVNEAVWPGRVDAYVNPVPLALTPVTLPDSTVVQQPLPDPTLQCTTPGQQACHLWNAGGGADVTNTAKTVGTDVLLAQGLAGFDTAGNDMTKRRIFYAPQTGESRLFFQMPVLTDTLHLYDLENLMGLCGTGYSFYPPSVEGCTENGISVPASTLCAAPSGNPLITTNPCPSGQSTTTSPFLDASTAVTWAESIKHYIDPTSGDTVQYLLGDIFHSNPQVLGQPSDATLFIGNVDHGATGTTTGYQDFANAQQFRRKVVFFGSNDGQLHGLDAGTVIQGTEGGQPAWTFNTGTGDELFAFIPRTVMPTIDQLAKAATATAGSGASQAFMVDGAVRIGDGFFGVGAASPAWHSVVVGGLREGGRAYYALDVTQPDTLTTKPLIPGTTIGTGTTTVQIPNGGTGSVLPSCLNGGAGCQLPYPTPLWEFTDSCKVTSTCVTNCALQPCDEDASGVGKGQPDLGQTWSTPNIGRVRICDSTCATFHEQWVVVFGGGMDPANLNQQGNYLYMLDLATGAVIYKRPLNGSVPSEVAAIDTGLDGYIDTIYVGTTAGHLYKVDLTQQAAITTQALGQRVDPAKWKPVEIFDTEGRQMYYPPAVFFDAALNQFGLAWGTGNRQDLWLADSTTGRFYVMMDNGLGTAANPTTLPLKAANLLALTPDGANSTGNPLESPAVGMQGGYYFELSQGERVLSEAFALSGVLIFNSYQPKAATGGTPPAKVVCIDSGDTRVFLLNITTGNSLSSKTAAQGTVTLTNPTNRYFTVAQTLALNITTAQNPSVFPTKGNPNPVPTPGTGTNPPPTDTTQYCDPNAPFIKDVVVQIQKLMPSTCRFSNALISINLGQTSGQTSCLAAVPVCMIEKNWKEF